MGGWVDGMKRIRHASFAIQLTAAATESPVITFTFALYFENHSFPAGNDPVLRSIFGRMVYSTKSYHLTF